MGKHSKIKILTSLLCIIMLCGCKVKEGKNSDDGIEAKPTIEQPTETVTKVSEKQNTESEKQNMELHNQTQEDIKSIYLEMKERGITKIMRNDSSTSDLFLSMWRNFLIITGMVRII